MDRSPGATRCALHPRLSHDGLSALAGITNDPNRPDDPEYIVRLLGQVITVTLETAKAVKELPPLEK